MQQLIQDVTDRINKRSEKLRSNYLEQIKRAKGQGPQRVHLHCGNLAHGFAACNVTEKSGLRGHEKANIAIVSSYNDILSAHKPYEKYSTQLKLAINEAGGVAQFAGGVPAMCDGVTQGQPGMELSLMSRDVIALSTAIALSHNLFDGGLLLGICDKIVPGLLIAALRFGHLPFIFVPAGPMPTGVDNFEKTRIRQLYSEGKVGREALLDIESASYHSPGTCTFYGTANSNQLILEMMGLQLPGSSFVNPNTPLRQALTIAAAKQVLQLTSLNSQYTPIGQLVDAKTIVNAIVGLLASGGSTNHTMHLVAIAKAAGFLINWDDFSDLSNVTPLIAKIYPNGQADINQFQQSGGMAYFVKTLLDAELLHHDVQTIAGFGLEHYTKTPILDNHTLQWVDGPNSSANPEILTAVAQPFKAQGGLRLLKGNIGRAVIKTSSLTEANYRVQAPAMVFSSQQELKLAFDAEELNCDCVIVIRFQGPQACGMPELHQLMPILGVLQDRGHCVALVTDGRMSGASGKVPAAIHVTPEAYADGVIAMIENGDEILVDAKSGFLRLLVAEDELKQRKAVQMLRRDDEVDLGRGLFQNLRNQLSTAEEGACSLFSEAVDV